MGHRHMQLMADLLKDRENRSTKRSVAKLNLGELRAELEERRCSLVGSAASLRDRLLRALIREDERQREQVPWYEWDLEGAEYVGSTEEEEFTEKRRKKRGGKKKDVIVVPQKVSRGTQTDSSEEDVGRRVEKTVAIVHRPDVEVPVSSSVASASISSAPVTVTSAMPRMTYPATGKPYSSGEGGLKNSTHEPRLSINADFGNYLSQLSRGFEYYSAERIRKVRATGPETTVEQLHVVTPSRPNVPPVAKSRKWYTPAQDVDQIESVPYSSDSSESSGSQSGAESKVAQPRGIGIYERDNSKVGRASVEARKRWQNAQREIERTLNESAMQSDLEVGKGDNSRRVSFSQKQRASDSADVGRVLEESARKEKRSSRKRRTRELRERYEVESSESEIEPLPSRRSARAEPSADS